MQSPAAFLVVEPHTRLTSMKRFTNLNLHVIVIDLSFHISYEFEYFYQCIITPLLSEGLQGTHMNALNQFNSKLMAMTPRGGLWTFSTILALCEPPHSTEVCQLGYELSTERVQNDIDFKIKFILFSLWMVMIMDRWKLSTLLENTLSVWKNSVKLFS